MSKICPINIQIEGNLLMPACHVPLIQAKTIFCHCFNRLHVSILAYKKPASSTPKRGKIRGENFKDNSPAKKTHTGNRNSQRQGHKNTKIHQNLQKSISSDKKTTQTPNHHQPQIQSFIKPNPTTKYITV